MQLVIVESPAKAKTIEKYLGKDFKVLASYGHIRDLPPKDGSVRPDEDFAMDWEIYSDQRKRAQVKAIADAAKNADRLVLATDPDREGEAIAWHLREAIGGDDSRYKRVVFNEITKKAIQEAFSAPTELDINRVNAQQARRFLDRVVGYMVSPLLWAKIARGLSAGRVQSVAVRLIVEREKEIRAFVPEEYWQIHTNNRAAAGPLRLEVKKQGANNFRPNNKESAMAAVTALEAASFEVAGREDLSVFGWH